RGIHTRPSTPMEIIIPPETWRIAAVVDHPAGATNHAAGTVRSAAGVSDTARAPRTSSGPNGNAIIASGARRANTRAGLAHLAVRAGNAAPATVRGARHGVHARVPAGHFASRAG